MGYLVLSGHINKTCQHDKSCISGMPVQNFLVTLCCNTISQMSQCPVEECRTLTGQASSRVAVAVMRRQRPGSAEVVDRMIASEEQDAMHAALVKETVREATGMARFPTASCTIRNALRKGCDCMRFRTWHETSILACSAGRELLRSVAGNVAHCCIGFSARQWTLLVAEISVLIFSLAAVCLAILYEPDPHPEECRLSLMMLSFPLGTHCELAPWESCIRNYFLRVFVFLAG